MLADIMIGIEIGPVGMIVLFVLVVTLLGMFIDGSAIIFIVSPIMMPVVQALGVDQVWFGVLMMMAIAAGYVTPPFGMNLFFLKGILIQASEMEGCGRLKSVGMGVIWRACLPYVLIMYGVIGLVLLFPGLATWLPRMMH